MYNVPQTFGGVHTQRLWVDIGTIEKFLFAKWPATVIELGTGTGSFSVYLAVYCWFHDFSFHTFDTHKIRNSPFQERRDKCIEAIICLGGFCYTQDIFAKHTIDLIKDLVRSSRGPVFLYCDDGDKPREVCVYKGILRKGDFLGVHDYGAEIFESDLPMDSFVHIDERSFIENGSSNRIMERVS